MRGDDDGVGQLGTEDGRLRQRSNSTLGNCDSCRPLQAISLMLINITRVNHSGGGIHCRVRVECDC